MEIQMDIVQAAALRPVRPTHIMKSANISYNELKSVIEALEKRGVIRTEVTFMGKFYQTTLEGLKLLEDYRGIRSRLLGEAF